MFDPLKIRSIRPLSLREASDEEVFRALRSIPRHFAALQFGVPFATVSTSQTAKTVAGVQCPAQQAVKVVGFNIGFDGTSSTQGPAIVEIGHCTFATNPP